jgi:hypothetical protein
MKWCEIFRAGRHTDKAGRTREWTPADLDRIVTGYKPDVHEAPVCIDHNESAGPIPGGPAYGWVEALRRDGDTLLAKFKQPAPEFADAVNAGRFKKRSIGLYPDGTLRHVAFLGAQPPAVKGLRDFTFSDGDREVTVYSESTGGNDGMTIEELQAKLAAETAAREAAEATAKQATDKATALEAENKTLSASFAEAEQKRRRAEIDSFIDAGIKDAKILPAWKQAGMGEFMAGLDGDEQVFQFSEGTEKRTRLQWFKDFIASIGQHQLFAEFVRERKTESTSDSDAALADKIARASGCAVK